MAGTLRSALVRTTRGLLLLSGIAVFAVGLSMVFVPQLAQLVPVGAIIELLGSDYFVVAAVGLAAVGVALFLLAVQSLRGVEEATTPVVEEVASAPYPGRALDRAAGGLPSESDRRRLREAAVQALVRSESCSRSDAEQQIAEGAWTDDTVAAEFLADDRDGAGDLLRGVLSRDRRLERTMEAIERLDSEEGSTDEDDSRHTERVTEWAEDHETMPSETDGPRDSNSDDSGGRDDVRPPEVGADAVSGERRRDAKQGGAGVGGK